MTPAWRALVVRRELSRALLGEIGDASGAYAIREKDSHRVVYVGESHTGAMRKTMLRHFHAAKSFQADRRSAHGGATFATEHPERYEVAIWVTSRGKRTKSEADERAMKAQATWIETLKPEKNVDPGVVEDFEQAEEEDTWGGLLNPGDPFPASAGPWFRVVFVSKRDAARFVGRVTRQFGYQAVPEGRIVTTNAEKWQIDEVLSSLDTKTHRVLVERVERLKIDNPRVSGTARALAKRVAAMRLELAEAERMAKGKKPGAAAMVRALKKDLLEQEKRLAKLVENPRPAKVGALPPNVPLERRAEMRTPDIFTGRTRLEESGKAVRRDWKGEAERLARELAECKRQVVPRVPESPPPPPAPRVLPPGYGETNERGQARMFGNPALVTLGKLTALSYKRGGKKELLYWPLRSAPILAYDREEKCLHVVYAGKVVRPSTSAEDKEYRRAHWGERGEGKVRDGRVASGPFWTCGAAVAVVYTTKKGDDAELTDYEHPFRAPPKVLEHRCGDKRCPLEGAYALAGGGYTVTEHGIEG